MDLITHPGLESYDTIK